MSEQLIDAMDNAGLWTPLEADGATPSTELAVTTNNDHVRFGADATSLAFSGSTAALDHRVERSLPSLDLTDFDELRLWIRADRAADGSPGRPFYLELRMAGATLGFDDAGNTWVRWLPVTKAGQWEFVRLSLGDLPPAIRATATGLRLRCSDASVAWTVYVDDMLAVRDELISDVEAALIRRLNGRISVGGSAVSAEVRHSPDGTPPPAPAVPAIRLRLRDVEPSTGGLSFPTIKRDYSGTGFFLSPPSTGIDLVYDAEVFTLTRTDHTRVLEFLLRELAPRSELVVGGIPLPVVWATGSAVDGAAGTLFFRVSGRQEVGTPTPATTPFRDVSLTVDAP